MATRAEQVPAIARCVRGCSGGGRQLAVRLLRGVTQAWAHHASVSASFLSSQIQVCLQCSLPSAECRWWPCGGAPVSSAGQSRETQHLLPTGESEGCRLCWFLVSCAQLRQLQMLFEQYLLQSCFSSRVIWKPGGITTEWVFFFIFLILAEKV